MHFLIKKKNFSFEKNYLKELDYKKIPVGKIILSTLMRKHKTSNLTQINKKSDKHMIHQ